MPRKPVLAVVTVDKNEVLFYRWQVVRIRTMTKEPPRVTRELVAKWAEHCGFRLTSEAQAGYSVAFAELAAAWARAEQLEAICQWLNKQEAGAYDVHNGRPVGPEPALVILLRREFQVDHSEEHATQDELATALQAVVDHLEAGAHNCKQAAQGIREALLTQGRKIAPKRDV